MASRSDEDVFETWSRRFFEIRRNQGVSAGAAPTPSNQPPSKAPFTKEAVLSMVKREYDVPWNDIVVDDESYNTIAVHLGEVGNLEVERDREDCERGFLRLIKEDLGYEGWADHFGEENLGHVLEAFKDHARLSDLEVYFAHPIRESNELYELSAENFWGEFARHGLSATEAEMKEEASTTRVKQLQDRLIGELMEHPIDSLLRSEEGNLAGVLELLRSWCHFNEDAVCQDILDRTGGIEGQMGTGQIRQVFPEGFVITEEW
jgi:hypothetical protein